MMYVCACKSQYEIFAITPRIYFRNFRCDCGNSKFGGKRCKLYPVSKQFLDYIFSCRKIRAMVSLRSECIDMNFKNVYKFHNVRFDMQEKDVTNAKNHYNQNFKGLYCTCHRPYPDPEDEVQNQSNYTSQHQGHFSVRKDNSVLSSGI